MPRWPKGSTRKAGNMPTAPSGALAPDQNYRRGIFFADPFKVNNMQPDRAYRFVSEEVLRKSGGFDRRGWIPITPANSKGEALVASTGRESERGTELRFEDLVLCYMPKAENDRIKAELAYRGNAADEAVAHLKQVTAEAGAPAELDTTIQRGGITETIGG